MNFPASIYDMQSGRLGTPGILLLGILVCIILLPLAFFPLGPDSALFYVAGQKIVDQGAIHYRDIVDVKPPLIYYFNALSIILFGDSATSPRILDLLVQLASAMSIFFVVRRVAERDRWAIFSALLYPILYIGVSAQGTTQTESMVPILLFPALGAYLGGRSFSRFAVIGILCAIAFLFKFTLGILLIGFLVGDLLMVREEIRSRLRHYAGLAAGVGSVMLLFILYLTIFDAWEGLNQMRQWTAGYAGMQLGSISSFVSTVLVEVPVKLADEYSLTMLIGTLIAAWTAFRAPIVESESLADKVRGGEAKRDLLLGHLTIQFILLLATVALEGKWMHYHVMRFYGPGAVLGAAGVLYLIDQLRALPNRRQYFLVIPLFLFLLLGLSPISRYYFHSKPAIARITGGDRAFDAYYGDRLSGNGWSYHEVDEIGKSVREALLEGEKVEIISGVASLLYLQIGLVPETAVFHSGFVIAPYAPPAWPAETKDYILDQRPRFVIIQTNDQMPLITTVDATSWETVQSWPEVSGLLRSDYQMVDSTNSFVVFEKSSDRPPRYRGSDQQEIPGRIRPAPTRMHLQGVRGRSVVDVSVRDRRQRRRRGSYAH